MGINCNSKQIISITYQIFQSGNVPMQSGPEFNTGLHCKPLNYKCNLGSILSVSTEICEKVILIDIAIIQAKVRKYMLLNSALTFELHVSHSVVLFNISVDVGNGMEFLCFSLPSPSINFISNDFMQ